MKFIFPKNYRFSPKLLGFIDYTSAIIILILGLILILILNIFIKDLNIKIFFFISLFLPVVLFILAQGSKENIIFSTFYILKFIYNRNIYLYEKKISSLESNPQVNFFECIEKFLNKILQI